jgi:hypothetical protein
MVRSLVVEIELAEPTIGQMQFGLLTEFALAANAITIANNQHAQHQFGINRRSANVAIKSLQRLIHIGQNHCNKHSDPTQQEALRNNVIKIEIVR